MISGRWSYAVRHATRVIWNSAPLFRTSWNAAEKGNVDQEARKPERASRRELIRRPETQEREAPIHGFVASEFPIFLAPRFRPSISIEQEQADIVIACEINSEDRKPGTGSSEL